MPTSDRRAVALLMGIGEYEHADRINHLPCAQRDAIALAECLANPSIGGFAPDNIAVLTHEKPAQLPSGDPANSVRFDEARRDTVVHYLHRWLNDKAKGADLVFLFFAGHATVHSHGPREEAYLILHDTDPNNLPMRGISMSELGMYIGALEARAVVVCLDCCHAGKLLGTESLSFQGTSPSVRRRGSGIGQQLLKDLAGQGRFLLVSCAEGQQSIELDTLGHGLFTHHLLEGLRGRAQANGNGPITVITLFDYVTKAVRQEAEKLGCTQTPWAENRYDGDVPISFPGVTPRDVVVVESSTVPPSQVLLTETREDELLRVLIVLEHNHNLEAIPGVMRCLAHRTPLVRQRASAVVGSFGWDKVVSEVQKLARSPQADAQQMGFILDGLQAYSAHESVETLLKQLVAHLRGDLRNRTIALLGQKRLSLRFQQMVSLFESMRSPYQLEEVLGEGLFTAVYRARHERAPLDVVVRVLRPEFVETSPQVLTNFLDLLQHAVCFVDAHLVLTRDVRAFPEEGIYYAVRDFVNGVTLQRTLDQKKHFEPLQILSILRQVSLGLQPVHKAGLAHGGIKPSNIFIRPDQQVLLGDLSPAIVGLVVVPERLAYDYRYAPPEMSYEEGAMGPHSDFYSLGCVAYELCCGAPPFRSDNFLRLAALHASGPVAPPSQRGSKLGVLGDQFILRLLSKSPTERFANIQEVLTALEGVQASLDPNQVNPISVNLLDDGSLKKYEVLRSMISFVQQPKDHSAEQPAPSDPTHERQPPENKEGPSSTHESRPELAPSDQDHIAAKAEPGELPVEESADGQEHSEDPAQPPEGQTQLFFCQSPSTPLAPSDPSHETGVPSNEEREHPESTPAQDPSSESMVPPKSLPPREESPQDVMKGPPTGPSPPTHTKVPLKEEEHPQDPGTQDSLLPPDDLSRAQEEEPRSWNTSSAFQIDAKYDREPITAPEGPSVFVPDPDSLPPGIPWSEVFVPGYEIVREIGRGGMGVVYQAKHTQLQRIVALKMIRTGAHASSAEQLRFRKEAQALARLQHPNIVQIYEVGNHQDMPFFAMEFVEGGSLANLLAKGPVPVEQTVALAEKLALAMDAAHRLGVIHRDLKPANVLLTNQREPKITDFGLAKTLDEVEHQTRTGVVMGTPAYMAPEQAQGDSKRIGPLTDVYALGAILYECLTGQSLFSGPGPVILFHVLHTEPTLPRRIQTHVPRDLETICLKCLQKDPSKRYASARDLAEELHRFRQHEPILARRPGKVEEMWLWVRRKPAMAGLVFLAPLTILFFVALISVLILWWQADTTGKDGNRDRDQEVQHPGDEKKDRATPRKKIKDRKQHE